MLSCVLCSMHDRFLANSVYSIYNIYILYYLFYLFYILYIYTTHPSQGNIYIEIDEIYRHLESE
jgi:hypothetical protein